MSMNAALVQLRRSYREIRQSSGDVGFGMLTSGEAAALRSAMFPMQRCVSIGSSYTSLLTINADLYGMTRRQDRSWFDYARYFLRDKNVELIAEYAVGGNDISEILAQIEEAASRTDFDWFVGDLGACNSLINGSPVSLSVGIAQGKACIDAIVASGKLALLIDATPIGALAAGALVPSLANHQKLSAWNFSMQQYAAKNGVVWVRVAEKLVDKSDTNGAALATMMQVGSPIDNVHYANRGSRLIGGEVEAAWSPHLVANVRIPSSQADKYDAANNPNWLSDNPLMIGTTGTLTTGIAGESPAGCSMSQSSSGAITGTSAVTARADGYGNDWVVTITDSTASGNILRLTCVPSVHSRVSPGNKVRALVQLDITGLAVLKECRVVLTCTVDGVTTTANLWEYVTGEAAVIGEYDLTDLTGGLPIMPEFTIPAGAACTDLRLQVNPQAFGADMTAVIKMSRAGIERLVE